MAQFTPLRQGGMALLATLLLVCGCDQFSRGRLVRVTQEGDRISIRIREPKNTLDFVCRGDVEFSSDDRGVVTVSDSFRVRENSDGYVRQAQFTKSDSGLNVTYAINRQAAEFDADAEAWLATVIGRALRETSLGARQRAERIMAARGVAGVMAEIAAFEHKAPKQAYVEVLLDNLDTVPDQSLIEMLALANESLSDSQTAKLMDAVMERSPENEALTLTMLDVTNQISSTSKRSKALTTMAAHREFTRDVTAAAITTASAIDSSSNCEAALIAIIESAPNDPVLHPIYLDAAVEISSSMSQTKVILALIERSDLDTPTWRAIAAAIDEIASSNCRERVLLKFVEVAPNNTEVWVAWLNSVAELSSSGAKEKLLIALLDHDGLEPPVLDFLRQTIDEISSSSARNRLEAALENYQRSPESSI